MSLAAIRAFIDTETAMHDTEPRNPAETAHELPKRGEHPTQEKERLQTDTARDEPVRDRGPDTGGGKLRPGGH